eukprot:CAMPEP_0116565170 /NCGR_PEP_ID=MMETSP0397-20121206/13752_1 /TAXON_ID=216820 /ORGANISM="Cyclophora tenuis, Strain ECT3854" /LENGTH=233 /DNA_ID=CAMNT_0004091919 /DNA_START=146 /DNA_END=844 /DNA_ORIENTATION=+
MIDSSLFSLIDPSKFSMLERNVVSMLDSFFQSQPYLSAFVTCSFKASAADLVVQSQSDSEEEVTNNNSACSSSSSSSPQEENASSSVDIRRNIGFLLYGGLYQGMVQEYIYNTWYPSIFGDSTAIWTVLQQVMIDLIFLSPFICLPVAYLFKAGISEDQSIPDGLQKYITHVKDEGLLVKYWALWFPVQCLTFGVIPQHLRILFIAFVSFFWLMILSAISARDGQTATTTTTT